MSDRTNSIVALALCAALPLARPGAQEDVRVPRAAAKAVREYLAATDEKDEKKALKKALKELDDDVAVAAAALRELEPLTDAKKGTKHGLTFESGEHEWTYSIHLPNGYDGKERFAVLVLPDHGAVGPEAGIGFWEGKDGAQELILFRPEIVKHRDDEERFPRRQSFDLDQDVAAVMRDALRHLRLSYRIDHDRLFMTGLSQAGYYTRYFAATMPDQFAGIVPEAAGGVALRGAVLPLARNLAGMPVKILHAKGDTITPWDDSEAMRAAIESFGGDVELVTYTDEDYLGEPFEKRHPGPPHLRLRHVLDFAKQHRRAIPASFTRVLRYRHQGREGRFRVEAPSSWQSPETVTCAAEDGALSADAKVVYLATPEEVLSEARLTVKGRPARVKADVEAMLVDFKSHGDPARLCAAEVDVRG